MYRNFICIFSVLWVRSNAESCFTPLGVSSECISLFDCSPLVTALAQNIQSNKQNLLFLRQSHCGFDATGPKVCCGPLPTSEMITPAPTTATPVTTTSESKVQTERVYPEDSYPEPRPTCGKDSGGDRIFGGLATGLDEYPWMALLGYRTSSGSMRYECGGALINHRYVMTAAHCLVGPIQEKVGLLETARFGEYDTGTSEDCVLDECADPPQELPVQAFYAHENFTDTGNQKSDDIGLARLAQRVKYNDFVTPICLVAPQSPRAVVGNIASVAGWGKTLNGKTTIKQKVEIPFVDSSSCFQKYRKKFNIELTNRHLCAGGVFAKDSCTGDSGGPLMRLTHENYWEAVGVVSFGYGCGRDGWPAVYTSVASYHDWIHSKMLETNV